MYHNHQLVLPRCHVGGNVKLRRVVGALGISHKGAVHIQVHTAGYAEERDDILPGRILYRHQFAVYAHKVVLVLGLCPAGSHAALRAHQGKDFAHLLFHGNLRRIVGELVPQIHIEGAVVSPELPAGRHIDGVPVYRVRVQHIGQIRRIVIELEIPIAV